MPLTVHVHQIVGSVPPLNLPIGPSPRLQNHMSYGTLTRQITGT